jgi:hypothetical protein
MKKYEEMRRDEQSLLATKTHPLKVGRIGGERWSF